MTYKLEGFIAKIQAPIICVFGEKEAEYTNGAELSVQSFDKYWLVGSISARDEKIVLVMKENQNINNVEWIGEEAVDKSFF